MARVLLVEDSEPVRTVIRTILTDIGHSVIDAEGAAEAVELCQSRRPDAVVLDWDLPGFGSLEVLRHLHPLGAERPPILLMTAENSPQVLTLARAAGASHHIMKPVDRPSIEYGLSRIGLGSALDRLGERRA